MIDEGTKLFRNLIIDQCGYKIFLKPDYWLMPLQNYFETWQMIDVGTKLFWNLIIDSWGVQNYFETVDAGIKLFWNLIIDRWGYKIILKLDNWLMGVQSYFQTW